MFFSAYRKSFDTGSKSVHEILLQSKKQTMSTESIFSTEICIQFWKNSSMKGHSSRLAVQKMRFFILMKAVIRKVEKNDDVTKIVF